MDTISKEIRSRNMAAIKSKNTKPEALVRKLLFASGLRFRIHMGDLPGNPDIALKKYKTAVFVHGCFWHHHKDCRRATIPKTNQEYWMPKIQRNIERDRRNMRLLRKLKWNIIVVWECQLAGKRLQKTIDSLIKKIECRPVFI